MTGSRSLRRDARDNKAKLRAAALEVFLAKGLDASLDEIARAAGVSSGTLYNHFSSREGLIDAVLPDVAAPRLRALGEAVMARPTARDRLEAFVHGMVGLQQEDPAMNDAILRRYPGAVALTGACEVSAALGRDLVRAAHREGSLSSDFTEDDLFSLLWLAGVASREPAAPPGWRQLIYRALSSAWCESA
jgi:AcrR family transcriptional regulator